MTHFDFISTQLYTNTNKLWVNQCVFAYAKEHPTSNELTLLSPLLPSQYLQAKRSRCFVEVYLSCRKLLWFFLWSSCISVAFSNLPIYDYTMLQHFSKKKRYTEEGCMRNGVFLVLSVPQKNLAWGKTFLHVKGDEDPSVLHHITASENIISSSPNYLTISKLYLRKYHQQGIFVSFQVGKLQS